MGDVEAMKPKPGQENLFGEEEDDDDEDDEEADGPAGALRFAAAAFSTRRFGRASTVGASPESPKPAAATAGTRSSSNPNDVLSIRLASANGKLIMATHVCPYLHIFTY